MQTTPYVYDSPVTSFFYTKDIFDNPMGSAPTEATDASAIGKIFDYN